jgi:uncharacterized RDD family membrane protein YckC
MPQYGGFWIRAVAYFIDVVLLYIVDVVVGLALGFIVFAGLTPGSEPQVTDALVMQQGSVTLILFVVNVLYFALMESSSRQGTVGKIAMGLVVTDLNGERISFPRALGRYFGKILSAMILLVGFFMIGWTQRKQGLHDMIAGTLVYKARSPGEVRTGAGVFE